MSSRNQELLRVARDFGTPTYVYDADQVGSRAAGLKQSLKGLFGLSYAVKANPNIELLRQIEPYIETLDVSSFPEVRRALAAGYDASRITFSGPAKREVEIRGALTHQVGELVIESVAEAKIASEIASASGAIQSVLIRINPARALKQFGVSFSGKGSQFGIDEEVLPSSLNEIRRLRNLDIVGFHIYAGTNSLNPEAIASNLQSSAQIFKDACLNLDIHPKKLVFGSGFGVPYGSNDRPLVISEIADRAVPIILDLKADVRFASAECLLEMGRWLVAPAGWLLTRVLGEKHSRGVNFRTCDAGFNNHLAACGMMGTVIRRNWRFENLSNPLGQEDVYTLVGPLCTSIDVLASEITMPELRTGDVVAVENSGAYGLTASPTRFISHPEPKEIILSRGLVIDATEGQHIRS